MPFITLRDHPEFQIYFEVHGTGEPLLLVHPLMGNLRTWFDLGYVRSLAEFQLILVDALGHGQSSKPHNPEMYSLEIAAGYLAQILEFLEISKAKFFGYSMGALFGFGLAYHYPDYVESLVLGGNYPLKRPPSHKDERLSIFEQGTEAVLEWQAPQSSRRREYLKKQDYKALAAFLRAVNHYDIPEGELRKMYHPILLFAGSLDPMLPEIQKTADLLPNSRLIVLAGLDHNQAFLRKSKIIDSILEFLRTSKIDN
ncbi:MAG: alpha/beta fold hydrolase [Methanobacteriota archaeon]|nr:MAG: alpha/beta fold hydrolase [Euryarchaeota archaeon]